MRRDSPLRRRRLGREPPGLSPPAVRRLYPLTYGPVRLAGKNILKTMKIVKAYINYWKNFANFDGRATRTDFWVPTAFHCLLLTICVMCGFGYLSFLGVDHLLVLCQIPIWLAILVPNLSLAIRRLHDSGRGTIQILWMFLPFLGPLYLLIVCGFLPTAPDRSESEPAQTPSLA